MQRSGPGRWIAAAGGLLTMLAPVGKARACDYEEVLIPALAAALLIPGDVGVALPAADASPARFVLGWSWQIPLGVPSAHPARHRFVPGVDLLLHAGGASWRGRLGYRYGRRHLFTGAGVGIDGADLTLSPEIGVKFAHAGTDDDDIDASLHLLARAEIAPESGHVRGGTILLGWNLF